MNLSGSGNGYKIIGTAARGISKETCIPNIVNLSLKNVIN